MEKAQPTFKRRKDRKLALKKQRRAVRIKSLVEINQEFFTSILVTYLLLLLLEELKEGFVSNYLNLNIVLGIVLASGIVTVLTGKDELEEKRGRLTKKDYIWVFGLGGLGAAIICYKTQGLGYLSYAISIISGALIILLSLLLLSEENSPSNTDP